MYLIFVTGIIRPLGLGVKRLAASKAGLIFQESNMKLKLSNKILKTILKYLFHKLSRTFTKGDDVKRSKNCSQLIRIARPHTHKHTHIHIGLTLPKSYRLFLVSRLAFSKTFIKVHRPITFLINPTDRHTDKPTDRVENIASLAEVGVKLCLE